MPISLYHLPKVLINIPRIIIITISLKQTIIRETWEVQEVITSTIILSHTINITRNINMHHSHRLIMAVMGVSNISFSQNKEAMVVAKCSRVITVPTEAAKVVTIVIIIINTINNELSKHSREMYYR